GRLGAVQGRCPRQAGLQRHRRGPVGCGRRCAALLQPEGTAHTCLRGGRGELLMGPLTAIALLAGAVESFQVAAYNETQVEGHNLVYDETDVWLQKSWAGLDRSTHTFYIGFESLVEPS